MTDLLPQLQADLADRYTIERELGRGGMATVYLAQDLKHRRPVALKVLHAELAAVLGADRFLREIETAANLNHPHILPLFDSGAAGQGGREGALLWYAMPYVEGESLRDRLDREKQLAVPDALQIAREVADALGYAHGRGIIHRDIKPENILLAHGHALVADFGIARALGAAGGERLTETGLSIGTPSYMSPEQASGERDLDGRADIYALGCVLYEMLAGQPPFSGPTAQSVMARHAIDAVPPLHTVRPVAPEVEAAVLTALAKVPADRFATAGQFRQALAGEGSVSLTPRGVTLPRASSRRLWITFFVAFAVVLLAVGIRRGMWRRGDATSNPKLVAVLPFRVSGSNPDLGWLREGLVDLLAIKLTSEGGFHAAEPSAVLSAWRRVAGSEDKVTPETALEVGRRLGAGSVIDGSVVGPPEHLTIAASLIINPGGRSAAHASVEGPLDSLPSLVDQLAAQLLTAEAGVDVTRLSSRTTTSLPAIRAYLAGHAAFRRGNLREAFDHYHEATLLDSTFALAALEMVHASIWVGGDDVERARQLAMDGRDRLSPGDQLLLDIWTTAYPTGPDFIQKWQAAATAYPDRADMWYLLGDAYFHNGLSTGVPDPWGIAAQNFQRGWAIDSAGGDAVALERSPIFAEPLSHMVEIAQAKGDTASVHKLVALGLAADSVGDQSWYLRWHRAITLGDSARAAFWADSERIDPGAFGHIATFITWTGIGAEDYLRVANLAIRHFEAGRPGEVSSTHASLVLNGGRPAEVLRLLQRDTDTSTEGMADRIHNALFWGGDTNTAAIAFRRLSRLAEGPGFRREPEEIQLRTLCTLSTWRAAHGDYEGIESAISRLRSPRLAGIAADDSIARITEYATLCAVLLDATRATFLHLPEARRRLEEADEAARTYTIVQSLGANLVIARLAEEQGDIALALKAVRRRGSFPGEFPLYLSTFLREEGRLAVMAGDTAGAVSAFQHYLMLMVNPEPPVRPEVEQVRGELAKLLAEPRR